MSPSPAQASGARTLGDYEILHTIKMGGMGEVLLARKSGTGGFEKLVAIKTIRAEMRDADHARQMFLDEARLLGRLDHPQIAHVHDFGEDDGVLYLAMEYVAGIRFRDLIRRRPGPLVVARAMAQVCRGLHAAHELTDLAGNPLGVVHRDVSPENLLLTFDGRVKILDFGIALMRGRQAPVTELGTIKGKAPYLAPEQLKNEVVDRRTDIFAACLVLHELLTGEPVFTGDSVYAVARAIDLQDMEPPSAKAGPLPDGLDDAVLTGLVKDPEGRFENAQALARVLEGIANSAGGESLEEYASRELEHDRNAHRINLQRILASVGSGNSSENPQSRPSGVITAQSPAVDGDALMQAIGDDADGTVRRSTRKVEAMPTPRPGLMEAPPEPEPEPELEPEPEPEPRRSRAFMWVLLVLLLGVGAVGAVLLMGGADPDDEPKAVVVIDAGAAAVPAPDAALAAAPPVDASVVATAPKPKTKPRTPRIKRDPPKPKPKVDPPKPRPKADPPKPKPDPPQPDPKPTGHGYLTVAAEPYAIAKVDGKSWGATPIVRRKLPAGQHTVVLVHPTSGAVRLRRVVEVPVNGHRRVVLK